MGELRLEVREFKNLATWRWVLTDADGTFVADHDVRLDPDCWQYEAFPGLYGYLEWHLAPVKRAEGEARIVADVGAWIGEQVLGPTITAEMARRPRTIRVTVAEGEPAEARELLLRPLELGHANGRPLSAQRVTLVMDTGPTADLSAPDGNGIPAGERLRVLGLFSLPEGGQPLNLRRERHSLVQLIRSVTADGRAADVRVLQYGVTRDALRDALEDAEGWDLIHISGHGAPGVLLFEDERGRPDRVSADELVDLLDLARERVKLVTVSACWSAATGAAEERRLLGLPVPDTRAASPAGTAQDGNRPDGGAPDGGLMMGNLAATLAGRLGCAVLAMRYPVADNFATALTSDLYRLLADKGRALPDALGISLEQLAKDTRWPALSRATPALFGARAAGLTLQAPERSGPQDYDLARQNIPGFPLQPEHFVGRTGVMTRASAALSKGSGIPGVLLHGMPGGGKTACALELAYTHEHAFDQLIWYKAPDEGLAINGALTDFIGILERYLPGFQLVHLLTDPAKFTAYLPRLTRLAENERMLIVIDNVESLLTENGNWRDDKWGQIVGALSAHKGFGRIIVTTRTLPAAASGLRNVSLGG